MAKFKVGDEVRVGNPHLADRGRYGRVVSAGVDGNPLLYDVDLGGGVQLFSESDLVAANARSRNAVVQKALNAYIGSIRQPPRSGLFKKGDVVTLTSGDAQHRKWRIDEDYGDGYYRVVSTTGRIQSLSAPATIIKALNAAHSRNAKFYATGYTNGGANEKQIGPFKTKEEAIKAGREEQGASGTFRFAGVVGEDGAYVYHNSCSRNAKFKVGDKVKLIGVSPLREDFNSGIGKVTKVMERGNGAAYHVLFDGGREFPFVESQLVAANAARSPNAVVAKALDASHKRRS